MIHINSHEPKRIVELLSRKAETKVENFSPADYIAGGIAIERKTFSDFFSSLASGRLFTQLLELNYHYSEPILLLENFDLSFIKKIDVFYSILIKILFDFNVKIIFSHSMEHSAEIIYLLSRRNGSGKIHKLMPVYHHFRQRKSIEKEKMAVLSGLCNIGNKRAKLLLSEFKTIKDIINAEEEKLLSVKGIGKETVKNLKNV